MKTTIVIENNILQLVLTGDDEFEQNILRSFADKTMTGRVETGGFYRPDNLTVAQRAKGWSLVLRAAPAGIPRFEKVTCSQCGGEFGPGDHGFSDCASHTRIVPARR